MKLFTCSSIQLYITYLFLIVTCPSNVITLRLSEDIFIPNCFVMCKVCNALCLSSSGLTKVAGRV